MVRPSRFFFHSNQCNQTEAGRKNSLVSLCSRNISIHFCCLVQGTRPRLREHVQRPIVLHDIKLLFFYPIGCTALHHAAKNGHLVVVKWLIQEADVKLLPCSKKERTPRAFAKRNGHRKVVLYLAEMGKCKL